VAVTLKDGAIASVTVTATFRVRMLPAASLDTIWMVFAPKLEQPKVKDDVLTVTDPQLSVELMFNWLMEIVATPCAFKGALNEATEVKAGLMVSNTVTLIVAVATLPAASATVIATGSTPRSAQLKVDLLKVVTKPLVGVQLSTAVPRLAAVTEAVPEAFK
jgi:hypothetical protein